MSKLKFTKDLEGKTIYLKGTGNNARGTLKDNIYEAEVIKVTKVNVTLLFKGSFSEQKLRKHCNQGSYQNCLTTWQNSGFACYYCEQDILDERKIQENCRKIKDLLFPTYEFEKRSLTLEQTEAILAIIENKVESND